MGLSKNWRRNKRINSNFLIKFQSTKKAAGKTPANLTNISTGGLNFATTEAVAEGDVISLDILIPGYDKPISAEAWVLRVRPIKAKGGGYSVGVEFKNINKEDSEALDNFVRSFAKERKIPEFIDLPEFVLRKKKS